MREFSFRLLQRCWDGPVARGGALGDEQDQCGQPDRALCQGLARRESILSSVYWKN
jgi:hypothetical protein